MTEAEWLKRGIPILHFEADRGWPSPRKQRLFAVACCLRIQHLIPEGRWRDCLSAAEQYADRRVRRTELIDARPSEGTIHTHGATYANSLRRFSEGAVWWTCETKVRKYAGQVATNAACAVAYAALPPDEPYVPPATSRHQRQWSDAEKAEVSAQIGLLYEICGNPWHPVEFAPEWITSAVMALASQMYESRDFSPMPILADALQDAGCDDADVLEHCRGAGPHARGCWVVDLILGKE